MNRSRCAKPCMIRNGDELVGIFSSTVDAARYVGRNVNNVIASLHNLGFCKVGDLTITRITPGEVAALPMPRMSAADVTALLIREQDYLSWYELADRTGWDVLRLQRMYDRKKLWRQHEDHRRNYNDG